MDESDVEGGIENTIDFLALLWNKIFMPILEGLAALIEMLPPIATGLIAAAILGVWLWRRARGHG